MLKVLVFSAFLALVSAAKEFAVPILERGMLVNQKVKFVGHDLEIFEVPKHHELSHVTVLLDFNQRHQMMVYHAEKECRLSELPSRYESPRVQKRNLRHLTQSTEIDASLAHTKTRLNYRDAFPLDDVSYLRHELQEACSGLPVYRMRVVEVDGLMNNATFYDHSSGDLGVSHSSHGRFRRQSDFMCAKENFMQKCYVKKESQGCYYIIHCEAIGVGDPSAECIEHIRDTEVRCVPCCDDRAVPAGSFIQDCLNIDFSAENSCNRTLETSCYPMPAPQNCARTIVRDCRENAGDPVQQMVTIERCGNWECEDGNRKRK